MDIRKWLNVPSKPQAKESENNTSPVASGNKRKRLVKGKVAKKSEDTQDYDDDDDIQIVSTKQSTAKKPRTVTSPSANAKSKSPSKAPNSTKPESPKPTTTVDPNDFFGSSKPNVAAKSNVHRALPSTFSSKSSASSTKSPAKSKSSNKRPMAAANEVEPKKKIKTEEQDYVPPVDLEDLDEKMFEDFDDIDDDDFVVAKKESAAKAKDTKKQVAKKEEVTKAKPKKEEDVKVPEKKVKKEAEHDEKKVEEKEKAKKAGYQAFLHRSGPSALGSKEIPEGEPNCLHGLTFVLTGELSSITREDTTELIKRHGGRVTSAVSGKTSYLIVGEQPGETKLKKAQTLKVKQIDEDELFNLIRKSKGVSEDDVMKDLYGKKKGANGLSVYEEMKKAKEEREKEEEEMLKKAQSEGSTPGSSQSMPDATPQLWTEKYRPKQLNELIGNKSLVERLQKWLHDWDDSRSKKFKWTGDKNSTHFRAALLSGPPGIGKTTSAHMVANLEGFEVLEFNASDTRSKKSLDQAIQELIGNRTIGEFFSAEAKQGDKGKSAASGRRKLVIIMDEVDGMSSGDRGGLAELSQLIKKTKVPIICVCNDRSNPKMKTLGGQCLDLKFRRTEAQQVRSRMMTICYKEGLKVNPQAIDNLVAATNGDIRQILNLLSTYRLNKKDMSFEDAKALSSSSEKDVTMGLFDIVKKYLDGQMFRKMSFADKYEPYFIDYDMGPLMVQENYIRVNPSSIDRNAPPSLQELQKLECISRAADSIASADLFERSIRQGQNWGLMQSHATFSCVLPASYMCGFMSGMYNFASYLGNMSKTNKGNRMLKELAIHMRLKISADKNELRQSYLPTLIPRLTLPLIHDQQDDVPKIIDTMDEYYISREDWDSILDLALGEYNSEVISKKIPSTAKSRFTREYNKRSHPVPLGSGLSSTKKSKAAASSSVVPDLEDVHELEDEGDVKEEEDDGDDDISKDKLIQQPKKTKGKGKAAAGSSRGTAKGKSKASGSGTGRGKGKARK
ncbi:replication factor RFC1 C terminal domain-containing protein [Paraphysoderma sedebokerense]|nr:replication factor RFC1 C terminal domain-containing protein [Paraphysoderma sedebokerense]